MQFDFSVLKTIDFTNSDSILFFSILLILIIIILLIIFAIVYEIFRTVGRSIKKKSDKNNETKKTLYNAEQLYSSTSQNKNIDTEDKKTISSGNMGEFAQGIKSSTKEEKNSPKTTKEQEKKKVEEYLASLKNRNVVSGDKGLESKMPSRNRKDNNSGRVVVSTPDGHSSSAPKEDNSNERVVIPVPQKNQAMQPDIGNSSVVPSKNHVDLGSKEENNSSAKNGDTKHHEENQPRIDIKGKEDGLNDLNKNYEKYFDKKNSLINEDKTGSVGQNSEHKALIDAVKSSQEDKENLITGGNNNQDKTIFHGKSGIKMKEAVYKLTKKTSPIIKGGLGGVYTLAERKEIAKKISDFKKFGSILQKSDKSRIYKTLAKEKLRATPSGRLKIEKQVRFLKNTIGK